MKRRFTWKLLTPAILFLLTAPLVSCSRSNDPEPEKGAVSKMTDQAAEEIGEKIRTPIDKARAAQETQADRNAVIDDTVKKQ